jgi:hypothetical protein
MGGAFLLEQVASLMSYHFMLEALPYSIYRELVLFFKTFSN